MTEKAIFRLYGEAQRNAAIAGVRLAQTGMVVEIKPATRNSEQNRLLHAALSDIAEQVEWKGQRFDLEAWKRLCTAAWLREMGESPELIPALDGKGFDIIYEPTSKMTVKQMTSLIDWILAFGAQNNVQFKERA